MASSERLAPGDWVVYTDADKIEWGPWEISQILCDSVVVHVDDLTEHSVPRVAVRKARRGGKPRMRCH